MPELGDTLAFLNADSILGLENMDFAFAGLPAGLAGLALIRRRRPPGTDRPQPRPRA